MERGMAGNDTVVVRNSPEQLAEAERLYPGDWWRHLDGDHRPVPVVVGHQDPDGPCRQPREALPTDPVWRSDGTAPIQVLGPHYDVWYFHRSTGTLIRWINTAE